MRAAIPAEKREQSQRQLVLAEREDGELLDEQEPAWGDLVELERLREQVTERKPEDVARQENLVERERRIRRVRPNAERCADQHQQGEKPRAAQGALEGRRIACLVCATGRASSTGGAVERSHCAPVERSSGCGHCRTPMSRSMRAESRANRGSERTASRPGSRRSARCVQCQLLRSSHANALSGCCSATYARAMLKGSKGSAFARCRVSIAAGVSPRRAWMYARSATKSGRSGDSSIARCTEANASSSIPFCTYATASRW